MKKNILGLTILCFLNSFVGQSVLPQKVISKIIVFYVPKGKVSYIGVSEGSIRTISNSTKYEILDINCLNEIQKKIEKLKKLTTTHTMRSIYMLCEIFYENSSSKVLSFEEATSGSIKMGNKIFMNSGDLESWLIACKQK